MSAFFLPLEYEGFMTFFHGATRFLSLSCSLPARIYLSIFYWLPQEERILGGRRGGAGILASSE